MALDTFLNNIDGAAGTIIWRNGIGPGMPVEVLEVGEDYAKVTHDGQTYLVPRESFLSFRFARDPDAWQS